MTGRTEAEAAAPSIDTVQRIVAAGFGVRVADLKSARRSRPVVRARHMAMFLCREHTGHSLPVIGRHFGKRDHTTVMYAIRQTEERRGRLPEVRQALSQLSAEVSAAINGEGEKALPGPVSGEGRARALEELAPLLARREVLLGEIELVDARIDEITAGLAGGR